MRSFTVVLVAVVATFLYVSGYAEAATGEYYDYVKNKPTCPTRPGLNDVVAGIGRTYWTNKIVAASTDPNCGRSVTVTNTANKKSVTAKIVDKCDSCLSDKIKLSPAAFEAIATDKEKKDKKDLKVTWTFADGTPSSSGTASAPEPAATTAKA